MKPSIPPATLRLGIEVELLMPAGLSRRDLALSIARKIGGTISTDWHIDDEPSVHKDVDVFHHLTPRFIVKDASGNPTATFVDDITIRSDLDPEKPSLPGWNRIVGDDRRILRMLGKVIRPGEHNIDVVSKAVSPFGLVCIPKGETIKLVDDAKSSIALVVNAPGERHRVTECISPPLEPESLSSWLELVVGTASEVGAGKPTEGATHLHYDSHLFATPEAFQRLVWVFGENHDAIRRRFRTNTNCRRIGPLPDALMNLVTSDEYETLTWKQIRKNASNAKGLTKYADVNVINLLRPNPLLATVEFRMLPTSTDPSQLRQMVQAMNELVETIAAR